MCRLIGLNIFCYTQLRQRSLCVYILANVNVNVHRSVSFNPMSINIRYLLKWQMSRHYSHHLLLRKFKAYQNEDMQLSKERLQFV